MAKAKTQRYLILPARGVQAVASNASAAAKETLISMAAKPTASALKEKLFTIVKSTSRTAVKAGTKLFNVIASANEDSVKLVEASPEMIAALRFEQPGLRAVPEVFYRPAFRKIEVLDRLAKPAAATAKKLIVKVTASGKPIVGAEVVAFTKFATLTGVSGRTSSTGKVTLSVPSATKYERIYVQHEKPGSWSYLGMNQSTTGELNIALTALDLTATDSLRHFHSIGGDNDGKGVRVGVVDSGVDLTHADLKVAGGLGCVPGSPTGNFGASGAHGTHVAGIIAGRGQAATGGMRGLAPAAEVFSYRVFDDTVNSGSSFGLVKAIQQGIQDKCDLLNLSLSFDHDENTGLAVEDVAVSEAISEAHKAGIVVVVAAGNDGRKPVSYPAADDLAIAVSALGRKGTFPGVSSESGDVLAPFGADTKDFLAAFSNVGTELDVAGAGVGVVSTVPGGYAPISGTSMACPAVTGVLARLLAAQKPILDMSRDSDRSDKIKELLFASAKSLGFDLKERRERLA